MRLIAVIVLCSSAAFAERVGLYPLQLPHGDTRLSAELAATLHEPRNGEPLQLLAPSACAPDEDVCLAAAARSSGLTAIASAAVDELPGGYKLHVRAYSADGRLIGEWQQDVQGGSDELGSALQRGVCESLGAVCAPNPVSVPSAALAQTATFDARSTIELGLFGGGAAMLVAAAGVGLYAHVARSDTGNRTALTANASPAHSANIFAVALAATGAGAIAAGGLIVALTPQSAAVQLRF